MGEEGSSGRESVYLLNRGVLFPLRSYKAAQREPGRRSQGSEPSTWSGAWAVMDVART